MKKILTVIGARPQFIKCAPVSNVIRKYFKEILVHTGQHYDYEMSKAFFEELNIPKPDCNLGIGSDSHSVQTARILIKLEKVVEKTKPDLMMVYGDTNSTLAGSLVASKLLIPLVHVEAGLRSFNRNMPEEINRICSDRISDFLFCPTITAKKNLRNEGIKKNVYMVGDVMKDLILQTTKRKNFKKRVSEIKRLMKEPFCYLTIHRQENTDNPIHLKRILNFIGDSNYKIVFPLHPRTKKQIKKYRINLSKSISCLKPISYFESLAYQTTADIVITDSGGMQKEAYVLGTPCITLRDETEWTETLKNGFNTIVGSNAKKFMAALDKCKTIQLNPDRNLFGSGDTSEKIVSILKSFSHN